MVEGRRTELTEHHMSPRPLLHLEGAAVFIASLIAYQWNHGGWLLFALLFLVPDLSMLGYAINARVGAITYNAIHTYIGPLVLSGYFSELTNICHCYWRSSGLPTSALTGCLGSA
jgi:Domain of unknown function (DUF4260)